MSLVKFIEPEAAINLITNPSFRFGVTGYTTGGTNTIARDDTEQFAGPFSCKATYNNDLTLLSLAPTGLTANKRHYFQARVWVPSDWDGGTITADFANYTGATEVNSAIWSPGDDTGKWIWIYSYADLATDVTGNVRIQLGGAPTAGRFIYIDALMLEQNDTHVTTWFDGDTEGCSWLGARHAATSERPGDLMSGGWLADAYDDYGLAVTSLLGMGMSQVVRHRVEIAGQEGALREGYYIPPRVVNVGGRIVGSSLPNLHAKRGSLVDLLRPDKGTNGRRVLYYGADANKPVYLEADIEAGLEFAAPEGFTEPLPGGLRLVAADPFIYELGGGGIDLVARLSLTANYIAERDKSKLWGNMAAGLGNVGNALVETTGKDIVAAFNSASSPHPYISRWDGSAWNGLGSGLGGIGATAQALARDVNGDIIVGGNFTTPETRIARWNGSSWSGFGTGADDAVRAVAVDYNTGRVWATGSFLNIGGVAANRLAYWNGSTWVAVGTGLNGIGRALAVAPNGDVFVGGDFTTANGTTVNGLARYNRSTNTLGAMPGGSAISSGTNRVWAVAVAPNGDVFIGGEFDALGGVSCLRVGYHRGRRYYAMGGGLTSPAGAICYSLNITADGSVYVGGYYDGVSSRSVPGGIAIWKGKDWQSFQVDLPGFGNVFAILNTSDGRLVLGGDFNGTSVFGYTTVITNQGSAKTYPVFEFSGPATIRYLINHTTGAHIALKNDLVLSASTQRAILDLRPGSRSFTGNWFVNPANNNLFHLLARPSELVKFYLRPGDNIIEAYIDNASAEIAGHWPLRHWAVDGAAA